MFYDIYAELCKKAGEKPYSVPLLLGAKGNDCVTQWKKGSTPRQPMLQKIADHFGVTIDYLLTGKEKSPGAEAPELTREEIDLLTAFRSLPPEDRAFVLRQLSALSQQPRAPAAPAE